MSDLATKLTYLNETKNQIKEALGTNDDTFRDYVEDIEYENSYLAKLMANQKTSNATGTELSITDSADMYANVLDENNNVISGVTEQETREGYNLVLIKETSTITKCGVTCSWNKETGIIELNGTCNADNTCFYVFENVNLKANQQYSLQSKYVSGSLSSSVASTLQFQNYTNWQGPVIWTPNVNKSANYTPTTDLVLNSNCIKLNNGVICTNFKSQFVLKEGTEIKPYEQYGAMPSPDYPSEIECVTGTQEISFSNNDNTNSNLHTLHLGDIELYGNDTARDTLKVDVIVQNNGYKKVDKLYKVANWGKVVLNGTESIFKNEYGTNSYLIEIGNNALSLPNSEILLMSNAFKSVSYNNRTVSTQNIIYKQEIQTTKICVRNTNYTTLEDFKAYLAQQYANGASVIVVYRLATSTTTEITDTTLIADIESFINSTETYQSGTNIDSNAWLDITYAVDKDKLTSASVIDDIATASIEEII